jgi:hypothetical protein
LRPRGKTTKPVKADEPVQVERSDTIKNIRARQTHRYRAPDRSSPMILQSRSQPRNP